MSFAISVLCEGTEVHKEPVPFPVNTIAGYNVIFYFVESYFTEHFPAEYASYDKLITLIADQLSGEERKSCNIFNPKTNRAYDFVLVENNEQA